MSNRNPDGNIRSSMERSSNPRNDEAPLPTPPASRAPPAVHDSPRTAFDTSELRERVDGVLQSDIGVITLLNRLKQSIASARDFTYFLKERSALEEKHAQGLKKLCRSTLELIGRPESRQGSFAQSYEEITSIHDRMSDHGLEFAMSLHQMSDDLQEMVSNIERGRKHWKHTGLTSEQRLQDAEAAVGKAKNKYETLAEQYDRARTGDRQSGRFALKAKSAAQQEEDLNRKAQAADADYASKVQAARASRQELITSLRPQAVRALTELITECDSGLTLQLQKFASLNERLLLGNGLCVSPLKNQPSGIAPHTRSLREVAHNIDNEKDFRDYILIFSNKAGSRTSEIKYEKHPALVSSKQAQPPSQPPQQSFNTPTNTYQNASPVASSSPGGYERGHRPSQSGQISGVTPYQPPNREGYPMQVPQTQYPGGHTSLSHSQPPRYLGAQIPDIPPHSPLIMPGTNLGTPDGPKTDTPPNFGDTNRMRSESGSGTGSMIPHMNQYRDDVQSRPSQAPNNHFQQLPRSQPSYDSFGPPAPQQSTSLPNTGQPRHSDGPRPDLPPLNPVFGVTLDELFHRDGTAVPSIVNQCTSAVEFFGLDVEGIYRTSGSNPHIMEMKAMFDNDSSQVDFRNPTVFHQDIASVATLLKHFLRDLPDPLLTSANYNSFRTAARIEDDIGRRDSLHAIINELPDPHYATLRQLTLHLYKVAEHSPQNKMTPSNLAIVFGPTLMGQGGGPGLGDPNDAAWQARVVETIILNTYQIFDDDD
ncbi:hypothetical protein EPUS_08006 [Endocarpon pusillum Z07020]|uniref:Rho-GAP domain-containing protein n=1 Tax=Endocarpon pusillum (strain Z07020 / HMAS-L-300199) TaxID=1263415 RepID=U1GXH4_ENDPU|nr:uncharacterized protein EPUS_08006 [Endocarpon pusillum Z07020]ERF76826.1 hypothetical protein EPUS_08006 [Endocarpon pusillum Z07020]